MKTRGERAKASKAGQQGENRSRHHLPYVPLPVQVVYQCNRTVDTRGSATPPHPLRYCTIPVPVQRYLPVVLVPVSTTVSSYLQSLFDFLDFVVLGRRKDTISTRCQNLGSGTSQVLRAALKTKSVPSPNQEGLLGRFSDRSLVSSCC